MFPVSDNSRVMPVARSRAIMGPDSAMGSPVRSRHSASTSPYRIPNSPLRFDSALDRSAIGYQADRSPRRVDDIHLETSPLRADRSPYRSSNTHNLSASSSTVNSPTRRKSASFLLPDGRSAVPARTSTDHFSPTSQIWGQRVGGPLPAPRITADDALDAAVGSNPGLASIHHGPYADQRPPYASSGYDTTGHTEVLSPYYYNRADASSYHNSAANNNARGNNVSDGLHFPTFNDTRVTDYGGSRGRVYDESSLRNVAPKSDIGVPPADALHAAALSLRRQEEQLEMREEQLVHREAELNKREQVLRQLVYEALDVTNPNNQLQGAASNSKQQLHQGAAAGGPLAQQHAQRLALLRDRVASFDNQSSIAGPSNMGGGNTTTSHTSSVFHAAHDAMSKRSHYTNSKEGAAFAHYDSLMNGGAGSMADSNALRNFAGSQPLRQRSTDVLNALSSVSTASQGVMNIAGEHMMQLREEVGRQRLQLRQLHEDLTQREKAVEAAALAVKRHEQRLQMRGMELDTRERALLAEEEGMVQDVQRHAHKINHSSEVMRRRIATLETKEKDLEELVREIEIKDEELVKREKAVQASQGELAKSHEAVAATLHRAHELEHHAREMEQAARRLRVREGALWNAVADVTEQHTMRYLDSEEHIKELQEELRRVRLEAGSGMVRSRRGSTAAATPYMPRTPTAPTSSSAKDKGIVTTPRGPHVAPWELAAADNDTNTPIEPDEVAANTQRLAELMSELRGVQSDLFRAQSAQLGSGTLGEYGVVIHPSI